MTAPAESSGAEMAGVGAAPAPNGTVGTAPAPDAPVGATAAAIFAAVEPNVAAAAATLFAAHALGPRRDADDGAFLQLHRRKGFVRTDRPIALGRDARRRQLQSVHAPSHSGGG